MLKKTAWAVLGLFLLAQLVQPDVKNPAVDPAADLEQVFNPPGEVMTGLKTACYDCHSNQTRYPWYSRLSPVSWWISQHVKEGREHLNFSEIGRLSPADCAEALGEAAETIQEGEMPLSSYTWLVMHPEANLTDNQRNTLVAWLTANSGGIKEGKNEKEYNED
ncbi:MAG: heme-binding domain-containing protein [Saprospiraceae bacterium]|nr:heme-binding domain-containing protein [Saprospiraceae bacterium]